MAKKLSVKTITGGAFGALTDVLLWYIYLVGASFGKQGPAGVYKAFREADEMLSQINHRTLAATWHILTKKKLVTYQKRDNLYFPQITAFGKKRLDEMLPTYHATRPWDSRIYLITYDVPEKSHKLRDALRHFLDRLGCKLLQESVWFTPYNPRELVNEFVRKERVPGTIIISDVGKDGGVGESTIQDLLVKLYNLENLNQRYEIFILHSKEKNLSLRQLLIEYLSILSDDPQLPFPLLPKGYLAEKAFNNYKMLLEKLQNSMLGRA